WPLVISIVLGGFSVDDNSTEVRSTRYASATDDCVSSASSRSALKTFVVLRASPLLVCFEPLLLPAFNARLLRPPIAGMTLRAGSCVYLLTSSTVLTVLSRYSRKNTSPTPASRLTRNPISMVRGLFGDTGDIGTCGGSIILVLLCCSCS